LRVDLTLN